MQRLGFRWCMLPIPFGNIRAEETCHHKWLRQTWRGKTEGNLANQEPNISTNKARKEGFNPVNEKEVSMKPKDMPNQGFVNK